MAAPGDRAARVHRRDYQPHGILTEISDHDSMAKAIVRAVPVGQALSQRQRLWPLRSDDAQKTGDYR